MNRLADRVIAYTDDQASALWQARLHIAEDEDSAGIPVVSADHTIKIDQWTTDGQYVRTWIAKHDGHLTWKS
jgi:hypothetical protein